jgi:periplasmic mercuric ion binding protein
MKKTAASFLLGLLVSAPAIAEMRTVTLSVPGMTCAACPITVKKALSRVDGVVSTTVSFENREAVVVYDDARTSVQALTLATRNAGFPSKVKE